MSERLFTTELRDDRSGGLDLMSAADLVAALAAAQARAAQRVVEQRDAISALVERIGERFERGGRLHYVGAGTSGRLAVLDASEMPPTFGTSPDLVCAHIAGGDAALRSPAEAAEDDADAGASAMRGHAGVNDVVIGISASGGARYVVGALDAARAEGAYTAAIVNSEFSPVGAVADLAIVLRTGAEPLAGSTRLVAGTAQKIALNTISTAVMVRCGRVYDNLMIDVVASNEKLRVRANRLVRALCGLDEAAARDLLAGAGGSVKIAVVMAKRGVDEMQARALLARCGGRLRSLIS